MGHASDSEQASSRGGSEPPRSCRCFLAISGLSRTTLCTLSQARRWNLRANPSSNLPFGEWGSIFQGERMTAALLDRLTHRCTIFEMNGESYRFRESVKAAKPAKEKKTQES